MSIEVELIGCNVKLARMGDKYTGIITEAKRTDIREYYTIKVIEVVSEDATYGIGDNIEISPNEFKYVATIME